MQKKTISDMRQLASTKGGQCISKKYISVSSKLEWQCRCKHTWFATPKSILTGCWCPICADLSRRKYTLATMQRVAEAKGGQCLSLHFNVVSDSLEWQCAKGHVWRAVASEVQRGRWCKICAHDWRRLTLEVMQECADQRGGKCLSLEYTNKDTKLQWRCSQGHTWMATPRNVIGNGTWCLECSGHKKKSLGAIKQIAIARGGCCLSKKYVNSTTPLEWECAQGHRWMARPANITTQNQWCPTCARVIPGTLQDLSELAKSRGGNCLAVEYLNANTKVSWECANGHVWSQTPNVVRNMNSWCPVCPKTFREEICRAIFTHLFDAKFPRLFPTFLKVTPGKIGLQLDGYNEELGIAFEHHGRQHYQKEIFNQTEEQFKSLEKRDKEKVRLCKEHKVALVIIPELISLTPVNEVQDLIARQLFEQGVELPKGFYKKKLDFNQIVQDKALVIYAQPLLQELADIAMARGGFSLATKYKGSREKLPFRCGNGHEWLATPESIKSGTWCRQCAGLASKSIDDMHLLAHSRLGNCLSTEYFGNHTPLTWQCKDGHKWDAAPADVQGTKKKKGSWCPKCLGRKKTIEDLQALAKNRRGTCLSDEYLGYWTKHLWSCEQGHEWLALASSIKNGTWCPICAKKRTPTERSKN